MRIKRCRWAIANLTVSAGLAVAASSLAASGLAASPTPTSDAMASPSVASVYEPEPSPPVGAPWQTVLSVTEPDAITAVVAWEGGYLALGWAGTAPSAQVIWVSQDAIGWERIDQPFGPTKLDSMVQMITPNGDGLLALGNDGRSLAVWSSQDGRTWQRATDAPALESPRIPRRYRLHLWGAASGGDRVMVIGAYELDLSPTHVRVWSSADGRTWTRDTPTGATFDHVSGLSWVEGRYLATACCSDGSRAFLAASADGLLWEVVGALPAGAHGPVAWMPSTRTYLIGGSEVVAPEIDASAATAWASTNLASWTTAAQGPAGDASPALLESNSGYTALVGFGWDIATRTPWPWVMTSTDGVLWSLSNGLPKRDCGISLAVGQNAVLVACPGEIALQQRS